MDAKRTTETTTNAAAPPAIRRRNPARSKEAILKAATVEFCRHGFEGGRVEAISRRSKTNMRLLYHYFHDKAGLYLAVLERVYTEIRAEEQRLQLGNLDPIEGMRRLIDFTFSFFGRHVDYISLINNENMMRARYLNRSQKIRSLTVPLVSAIEDLLRRGSAAGLFRADVDPIQLYVSIVAQSYFHVSNRYTLSAIFNKDLGDDAWLEQRRAHAQDLILAWLTARSAVAVERADLGSRRRQGARATA
ncbi:MAG TPA: TetR/AcrR family transcriptional regulator [Alphaproteobacteria bacterium]